MIPVLLGLLGACGHRGPPAPAAHPPAITDAAVFTRDGLLEVRLACPSDAMRILRADVAVWRAGSRIGSSAENNGCTLLIDADASPGEELQLTGSVVGSYEWGHQVVLTVRLTEEVMP